VSGDDGTGTPVDASDTTDASGTQGSDDVNETPEMIDEAWLDGAPSSEDANLEDRDKILADSFPASDPPAQP